MCLKNLTFSFISLYYTKLVPTVITNKDTKSVNIWSFQRLFIRIFNNIILSPVYCPSICILTSFFNNRMNKRDIIKLLFNMMSICFYVYLQNCLSCLDKYDINPLNHEITRHKMAFSGQVGTRHIRRWQAYFEWRTYIEYMFQLKLLSDVHGEMSNGNYNAHDKKVQCLAVKKQLFA